MHNKLFCLLYKKGVVLNPSFLHKELENFLSNFFFFFCLKYLLPSMLFFHIVPSLLAQFCSFVCLVGVMVFLCRFPISFSHGFQAS
jgi:hypothetical protein